MSTTYRGIAEATQRQRYIFLPVAAIVVKRRKNEAIELSHARSLREKFNGSYGTEGVIGFFHADINGPADQ